MSVKRNLITRISVAGATAAAAAAIPMAAVWAGPATAVADPNGCVNANGAPCGPGDVNVNVPGAGANADQGGTSVFVPGAGASADQGGANVFVPGAGANAGPGEFNGCIVNFCWGAG
jgi:hypothetical protein